MRYSLLSRVLSCSMMVKVITWRMMMTRFICIRLIIRLKGIAHTSRARHIHTFNSQLSLFLSCSLSPFVNLNVPFTFPGILVSSSVKLLQEKYEEGERERLRKGMNEVSVEKKKGIEEKTIEATFIFQRPNRFLYLSIASSIISFLPSPLFALFS